MLQRRLDDEEFVEVGRLGPSDYFGKPDKQKTLTDICRLQSRHFDQLVADIAVLDELPKISQSNIITK